MKIDFRVHSVNPETVPVRAKIEGDIEVAATVMGLVVELAAVDRHYGSITFRFVHPELIAEAKEKFKPDEVISWEI